MVKLTPELIEQCAQYTNPIRDRELDLRGYKLPMIENMGATLDQFDTIDMSDNEIRKIDGFPVLSRLKSLLINNNRVVRIGENLEQQLPNLETLVLSNNNLQELGDIDNLASVKTLRHLSLMRNPVTTKKHYRLYVAYKLPHLRVLDFQKLKQKEREAAAKMFKGKKGAALSREMGKRQPAVPVAGPPQQGVRTFTPGGDLQRPGIGQGPIKRNLPPSSMPRRPDVDAIKKAIAEAKTLDEIERLNKLLQAGTIPGFDEKKKAITTPVQREEEMELLDV